MKEIEAPCKEEKKLTVCVIYIGKERALLLGVRFVCVCVYLFFYLFIYLSIYVFIYLWKHTYLYMYM